MEEQNNTGGSIALADDVPMTGHFYAEVRRGGTLVEVIDEKNLIVNGAKNQLARLLGGNVSGRSITQIGFGIGTTAAAPGDTALTLSPLYPSTSVKAIGSVAYPATGQVQFNWSLSTAELNGVPITEFGLLCQDGTLFSRKSRAPIQKESDLSLIGFWTILF
jgi:hypothetical protein